MLIQKDMDNQKWQQCNKIIKSTFNRSRCLKKTQNIFFKARFRCGNEELVNKFWKKRRRGNIQNMPRRKRNTWTPIICVHCQFKTPEKLLKDIRKKELIRIQNSEKNRKWINTHMKCNLYIPCGRSKSAHNFFLVTSQGINFKFTKEQKDCFFAIFRVQS